MNSRFGELQVFDALQVIESEAETITKLAMGKKELLSKQLEQKRAEIKESAENKTRNDIRAYSEAAQQKTTLQISEISVLSQRKYSSLEMDFDKNHDKWELELFNIITGK